MAASIYMGSTLGCWDVEYEYEQRLESTIRETLDQFKDGGEVLGWRF